MFMAKSTTAIVDKLYPLVEKSMDTNYSKYKKCLSNFMEKRSKDLFATAPINRIFYGAEDAEELYQALNISKSTIHSIIEQTYYWQIAAFKPSAAKDELTILAMMIIRYFYLTKKQKDLELACVYLAFSGKFYPSIHFGSFRYLPAEHIMNYVVNNRLSAKFDIVSQGSVVGAIRSVCNTWINSYDRLFRSNEDEDICYLIQQLHTRIKSFMKNIATEYYKAYEDKDVYMTYDSDNYDSEDYHLADNDSLKSERYVERAMSKINSSGVDYKLCKMSANSNVKTDEVKSIVESILSDPDNNKEVRELVSLLVSTYLAQSKTKDINDVAFITYGIAPKPNAKNKDIIRQKEIVENWLSENSPAYNRRKSRLATKNNYVKALFSYFTLVTFEANK